MVETFDSDGFKIAFERFSAATESAGRLPVLLIHGFASNRRVNWVDTGWTRTLTEAGYDVVIVDNRGHGQSGTSPDPALYGAPLMACDAARLLDHLGYATAHVMGYSMGARITAFQSMAHPERAATAAFGGLGINMIKGLGGSDAIASALEAPSVDDVSDPVGRTFRLFAEQTGSDLPSLAACIRSARNPITADAIGKLKVPVLVAVGTADSIGGSAGELAALIPNAQALPLEGRDHMKAVGDRTFKAEYLAFLDRFASGVTTASEVL